MVILLKNLNAIINGQYRNVTKFLWFLKKKMVNLTKLMCT